MLSSSTCTAAKASRPRSHGYLPKPCPLTISREAAQASSPNHVFSEDGNGKGTYTTDGYGMMKMEGGLHVWTNKGMINFVRAAPGIPGIKKGTKLKVLKDFISGPTCPLGAGLRCLLLERDVIAVFTGKDGVAWFKN